ncbi:MAG: hypothetical protein WC339_06430 [Candidatus Izemoplasmatales bacterium]|jgi:hypothetical protein
MIDQIEVTVFTKEIQKKFDFTLHQSKNMLYYEWFGSFNRCL